MSRLWLPGIASIPARGGTPVVGSHVSASRGAKVHAEALDGAHVLLDVDGEAPGRLPATFTVKKGALLLRA